MPQTIDLTEMDRNILKALQIDATRSARDLANDLNMSASTVWRRLGELEASGAIKSRVALLDGARVGFPITAFISTNLSSHESKTRQTFESFVSSRPEIQMAYAVTGEHDYTLVVKMPTVDAMHHFLMDVLLGHPSVASVTSQIALSELKSTPALPL